jgi:peptide/nickel transport system substrate-binding protein
MRSVAISVVVGALMVTTAACSGGSGSSSASGDPVVLQVPADPGILDPQTSPGIWGRTMMRLSYDTLVADGKDGEILPQLAESWDVTPTRATFKIKQGVKCDDGSDMTADVVAANFERLKDPVAKVPFTSSFMGSTDYTVSVDEASNSVTLDLPKPFSPLLSNLSFYPGMICQAGLDDPDQLRTKSFGTGPFILTKSQAGRSYSFDARKGYTWGPGGAATSVAGFPKKIETRVVDNETTAANLMLSGDLNLGVLTTRGAYERLASDKFTSTTAPSSSTFVHFNFLKKDSPIQDIAVRKALTESLDREAMSKVATGESDQTTKSVALPQAPCQDEVKTDSLIQFDAAKATADLEAAGWAKSGGKWSKDGNTLKINLLVSGVAGPNKPVGDYVLNAWRDLGVEVTVDNTDQPTGVERRSEGKYDIWVGAWGGVYNFPIIAPFLTSPTSVTYTYLANDEYTKLADQAFDADPSSTCGIWAEAQDAIDKQVSMVPMYYDSTRFVTTKGVTAAPYRIYIDPTSLRVK